VCSSDLECTEHGMFDEFLRAALGWKWE
jgi:hypothetical protein